MRIALTILDTDQALDNNLLRDLCRQEVENFDQYLKRFGAEYRDGLAKFERLAIEGYLYQKIRGHIDEKDGIPDLPDGRKDGQA